MSEDTEEIPENLRIVCLLVINWNVDFTNHYTATLDKPKLS
jgi:hypothetical protein